MPRAGTGEDDALYSEIQSRYGFALPADYRAFRARAWFRFDEASRAAMRGDEPWAATYLWLNEMEWMSLADIRDHEFPNYCLGGFVPFAFTGGGDHWCWYPKLSDERGVAPVVLCPHDSRIASVYAANFTAAVYRQALEYAGQWFDEPEELTSARGHLARWGRDLGPMMPAGWGSRILELAERPDFEERRGKHVGRTLLGEAEFERVLLAELGFARLDEEFEWMEP